MTNLEEILKVLSSREVVYEKKNIHDFFMKNYSPTLGNIILKINNPVIFERFTNIMQYTIDVSQLDKQRDFITKKVLFDEIDEKKEMFSFFNNLTPNNYQDYWFTDNELMDIKMGIKNNNFDEVLRNIANKWLDEYIIYYFFHDNYYNFLVNLNQMLRYLRNIKIDLVDSEHLAFYVDCYNISKMSFKEKVAFFKNNYQKDFIQSMFYDDMRIVKNHSYESLINSSLKISESKNLYNEKLSHELGIPVYYLNGEKFNAIVRCIIPNNGHSKEDYDKYVYSRKDKDYYSFSYIGDKNINSIRGNSYTLLYSDINPDYIAHIYHDDASSSNLLHEKHFVTDKFNEIHTPESLTRDTKYYNELVIKNGEDGIKPSAVVCYDEITKEEIELAKEYQLPILLINSKKYHQEEGYTDFDDYDTYSI